MALSLSLLAKLLHITPAYALESQKNRFFPLQQTGVKTIKLHQEEEDTGSVGGFMSIKHYNIQPKSHKITDDLPRVTYLQPSREITAGLGNKLYRAPGSKSIVVGDGLWPLPVGVSHHISSPFGHRIHPVTGRPHMHSGVDIAAAPGTPVLSTHDGVVIEQGRNGRLGNYIKIEHAANEYALYGHLSSSDVRQGQMVKAGEQIGRVGSTGRSTGPHLHYTLAMNGQVVDPMPYLSPPDSSRMLAFSQSGE